MSYVDHCSTEKAPDGDRPLRKLRHPLKGPSTRPLTRVEQQTLAMVAEGLHRAEIAAYRRVTVETVKTTLHRIRRFLGPLGAAGLVDTAYRTGLLPVPPHRAQPPGIRLDTAQLTLLRLLATGSTTRRIATVTHQSNETAKASVSRLRAELGGRTIAHTVHLAWQYRYLASGLPRTVSTASRPTADRRRRAAYGYMHPIKGMEDEHVTHDEQRILRRARVEGYDLCAIYYEEDDGSFAALSALLAELALTGANTVFVPSYADFANSDVLQRHLRAYVVRHTGTAFPSAEAQR
jgi:DNA-binding CsgD family transcriptional regulator